jgi:hypothetical protein
MSKNFLICVAAASMAVFGIFYTWMCYRIWEYATHPFTVVGWPLGSINDVMVTLIILLFWIWGLVVASGVIYGPSIDSSPKSDKTEHKNH